MNQNLRDNCQQYVYKDVKLDNKKQIIKLFLNEVTNENYKIVENLITLGSDIHCLDEHNANALHYAAYNNKPNAIEYLIKSKINIKQLNSAGQNPLFSAVMNNASAAFDKLSSLYDIDAKDDHGYAVIHYAIANESVDLVSKLFKMKKFNFNIVDKENASLLHFTTLNSDTKIAQLILDHVDIIESKNKDNMTPLLLACKVGNLKQVQFLLSKNANFEAKNINEDTILTISAESGHKDIVEFLLDKQVPYKINDNVDLTTKITKCLFRKSYGTILEAINSGDVEIVKFFVKYGIDLNTSYNDFTPLIYAVCLGNMNIINFILQHAKDKTFSKPLDKIELLNHDQITLYIQNINTDVEVNDLGLKIEYTPDQDKHIDWLQKSNVLKSSLETNRFQLFDNFNGKYGVFFYNDSVEADLILELEISNTKPNLVNFLEVHHSKVFLFEHINGVRISTWEKEQKLIEDILGVPVSISQYDRAHPMYDPKISKDKLIVIQEDPISVMPKKLNLEGSFLKIDDSTGITKYIFENVSKEDFKKWEDNLNTISEYLHARISIDRYNENTYVLTLIDAIEESLPSLLGLEDDKGNVPKLIFVKEENGNKYFYYNFIPTIKFVTWERKVKENSLTTLFKKPTAVFKISECDSTDPLFDNELKNLGHEQAIALQQLTSVPKVSFMQNATFLKDGEIFWGYGAGGLNYYTGLNDAMHMMVIGGTGSGKSTLMNGLLLSLIHNIKSIGKLYLIDLKSGVEFNKYSKLDSEKVTVFSRGTKPSKLLAALQEVEAQMYLRNEYLREVEKEKLQEEPIFIVIDEFAQIDLMPIENGDERNAKREIDKTLLKIGSLARAANIKLFIQTQDPSVVPTDLKKHLMSRILLKTGNLGDKRQTLQNPDEMDVLDINHVKFGKGRFVFEDYNDGDTKLTELQFPLLVQADENGENLINDKGSIVANLEYFMKYKEDAQQLSNDLNDQIAPYTQAVFEEYTHLQHTKTLAGEQNIGNTLSDTNEDQKDVFKEDKRAAKKKEAVDNPLSEYEARKKARSNKNESEL